MLYYVLGLEDFFFVLILYNVRAPHILLSRQGSPYSTQRTFLIFFFTPYHVRALLPRQGSLKSTQRTFLIFVLILFLLHLSYALFFFTSAFTSVLTSVSYFCFYFYFLFFIAFTIYLTWAWRISVCWKKRKTRKK